MTFARPEVLWMLALIPILLVLAGRAAAVAWVRALAFSTSGARQLRAAGVGSAIGGAFQARSTPGRGLDLGPGPGPGRGPGPGLGLHGVAIGLLVLAAAGPQVGVVSQEVPAPGVDVIVGLDASRSMWVGDLHPTRLARAQREIEDLANQVKGARFGLVSIGGAGELVAPLSRDRRAFFELVRTVNPTLLRAPGTDLAGGLNRCLAAFDPDSPAARAVVLFSDGGHQGDERSLSDAAQAARDAGVTVHAVLVGLASGGLVPVSADDPAPLLDNTGAPVRSTGSRAALVALTDSTGGILVEIEREPFPSVALAALGFAGGGPSTGTGVIRQVPVDRYRWFVIAAAVVAALGWAHRRPRLLARGFTSPRGGDLVHAGAYSRGPASARVPGRSLRAMALVGVSLVAADGPDAPPDRSVEALERAVEARPDDAARRYNLGVARTRAGDLDGADAAFSGAFSAALQDAAIEVAARCRYGRGVVRAVRSERLEGVARARLLSSASDDFAAALSIGRDLDGDRAFLEDAAWNLEWATLRLLAQPGDRATDSPGTGPGQGEAASGSAGEGAEDTGSATQASGAGNDPATAANAAIGQNGQDGQDGQDGPLDRGEGARTSDREGANGDITESGDPAPLPPAVDRRRNIVEIIARFAAERRAYDVRAARASRTEAENDW